jgi:hypothetical protein
LSKFTAVVSVAAAWFLLLSVIVIQFLKFTHITIVLLLWLLEQMHSKIYTLEKLPIAVALAQFVISECNSIDMSMVFCCSCIKFGI